MLATLLSWLVIFFVLFSFGNILLSVYNKFSRSNEKYNTIDTNLLGICLIVLTLSTSSLWLPSNQYILLAYIIIGVIYWTLERKKLKLYKRHITNIYKSLNTFQKTMLTAFVLLIFIYVLFNPYFFDAGFYHYRHMRWNEEYAVIPGLGNIEDRFGFNSSYLLISPIFSFRYIFGTAVYSTLQSLLFVLMFSWILITLFRTQYNIKYIIILILFLIFLFTNGVMLAASSTDIIPLLCTFYYITKTVLDPDWLKKQPLLACLLPITLITFKLSSAVFAIICLVVIFYLIKEKKYRSIAFISIMSFLILAVWCIRNIIITGYLIYPIYQIDLFSFDWKMPANILFLEKLHIYEWARLMFDEYLAYNIFENGLKGNTIAKLGSIGDTIIFMTVLASPIILIYSSVKKKGINKNIIYVYIASILSIIVSFISAPDPRFVYGYILGITFLTSTILLSFSEKDKIIFQKKGFIIILIIFLCYAPTVFRQCRLTVRQFGGTIFAKESLSIFFKQWHPVIDSELTEYKVGNITFYISNIGEHVLYDNIFYTHPDGLPFTPFKGGKIQNIKSIEMRGKTAQEGFRTKTEYINLINSDLDKYIKEYNKAQQIKRDDILKDSKSSIFKFKRLTD